VIERVRPEVDAGRFPAKCTVGERLEVTADIHADGHDLLAAVLRWRPADPGGAKERGWNETPMRPLVNDRWTAGFVPERLQPHEYTIEAWVDRFRTWQHDLAKRVDAGQDVSVALAIGAELIAAAADRAVDTDAAALRKWAQRVKRGPARPHAFDEALSLLVDRYPDRTVSCTYPRVLKVAVDRERARFGAWYEMFPRSATTVPGRHGTFKDCEKRIAYVAAMGFDVLYLPPIHPIGVSFRKGRNNTPQAAPEDVGSPWAIGSAEGGHKAIHPALGTPDDFARLVARAKEHGIEVALDIAFQCSPDHPYVKSHPEWFLHRPDGSIQYAENPPKKYEDIYPLNFEGPDWRGLWEELRSVVEHWIRQGVRIFRVDNPHTKPYAFWEWLIGSIREKHPEVIFLSEAFTRPKVMYRLAKLGFTQSYTYFAWRNTAWELREYFTELTRSEVKDFFRPSLWPNTPDILTEYLQAGGRPAFASRFVLAATLGATYGIYGPGFELCDNRPMAPGREEYLDSEKYQIRHWEIDRPDSLAPIIGRVNRIRRDNPALHSDARLTFLPVTNEQLVAYSKTTEDMSNIIVTVVNLDPHHTQSGFLDLPLEEMGIDPDQPFQVHDLLGEARYIWNGPRNYVELNPHVIPAHIFRVRRRLRTERDFDYYL